MPIPRHLYGVVLKPSNSRIYELMPQKLIPTNKITFTVLEIYLQLNHTIRVMTVKFFFRSTSWRLCSISLVSSGFISTWGSVPLNVQCPTYLMKLKLKFSFIIVIHEYNLDFIRSFYVSQSFYKQILMSSQKERNTNSVCVSE